MGYFIATIGKDFEGVFQEGAELILERDYLFSLKSIEDSVKKIN